MSFFLIGPIVEVIGLFYVGKWIYKKFIKGNYNELDNIISQIANSFKKDFRSNPDEVNSKTNDKKIYLSSSRITPDNEFKRNKVSYENAEELFKAGLITKKEFKELKK